MVSRIGVFRATCPRSLLSNLFYFYKVNFWWDTQPLMSTEKIWEVFLILYLKCTRLMCFVTFYYLYLALFSPQKWVATYQLTTTGLEYQSKLPFVVITFTGNHRKQQVLTLHIEFKCILFPQLIIHYDMRIILKNQSVSVRSLTCFVFS